MIGLKVGISRRFVPKFGYPGCWAFCNRRQTCRAACKPALVGGKPIAGVAAGVGVRQAAAARPQDAESGAQERATLGERRHTYRAGRESGEVGGERQTSG